MIWFCVAALDFIQDKPEETHTEERASCKQRTHTGPQVQKSATVNFSRKTGDQIEGTYTPDCDATSGRTKHWHSDGWLHNTQNHMSISFV